jgi:membrane protein implicated in regulation of membrane protease activity
MLLAVAVVLLLVLPDPWNLFAAATCCLLGLVEIYVWNRTVRQRPKVVDVQTLVGRTAEVRETCRPIGRVFVAGELWRAHCHEGADEGTRVTIVAVHGLALDVTAEP